MVYTHGDLTIDWLGYSTIRIETADETVLYLDPGRVDYGVLTDRRPEDADSLLVTHTHHYDPDAIDRVSTDNTRVYVFEDIVELGHLANRTKEELIPPEELEYSVEVFESEDTFEVGPAVVTAVPAYNHPSPEGLNVSPDGEGFQPQGSAVGFHLDIDGTRLFWPGDSDVLDVHETLDVDVFLPPLSQIVSMNRLEAAELAERLDPDIVIPVHYRWKNSTPDGGFHLNADPHAFKRDVEERGIDCEVLTQSG